MWEEVKSMYSSLEECIRKWEAKIEELQAIEEKFYLLEASEKTLEAELFLATEGTVDERKSQVYVSGKWIDFKKGLATAKSLYNKARRELELQQKAFDAVYLTFKIESEVVKKHP